jgi:hypothetical protein
MAIRGRKPTPIALRLITRSHLRDRPPPQRRGETLPGGAIERPEKISKAAAALWDQYIARAAWLTWADSPKAFMWCNLQAEFLKSPGNMGSLTNRPIARTRQRRPWVGIYSPLSKILTRCLASRRQVTKKYSSM